MNSNDARLVGGSTPSNSINRSTASINTSGIIRCTDCPRTCAVLRHHLYKWHQDMVGRIDCFVETALKLIFLTLSCVPSALSLSYVQIAVARNVLCTASEKTPCTSNAWPNVRRSDARSLRKTARARERSFCSFAVAWIAKALLGRKGTVGSSVEKQEEYDASLT